MVFQGCFKGVSRRLRKFHECFETFSRKFKAYRKSCSVVVVVAASRAEGGLVCIQETNCMEGNAQFSLKIPDLRLKFF